MAQVDNVGYRMMRRSEVRPLAEVVKDVSVHAPRGALEMDERYRRPCTTWAPPLMLVLLLAGMGMSACAEGAIPSAAPAARLETSAPSVTTAAAVRSTEAPSVAPAVAPYVVATATSAPPPSPALELRPVRGPVAASAASGTAPVELAADFTASLLGGGAFTLSEQRGHPVLVLFTASWCGDCIPEINKMAQLQLELGGRGLRQLVLSVDPSDTQAQFADFRQRTHGGNLQWALDPGQLATRAYRVRATDTKVLIGPQEQVAWRTMGPTGLEALRQRIVALIA